jgi:acyl-coenzyme A synthetase/AMP-(fatty) acid ligase
MAWRLAELFATPAQRHPALPIRLDRPLSIEPALGTDLRLDRVAQLTAETADRLRRAGVGPGDRVAVLKRPNLDISVLASAAAQVGAVPALLSIDLNAATVGKLLERLRLPHVITDQATREAGGLPEGDLGELARSVITVGPGEFDVEPRHDGAGQLELANEFGQVALITHTSGTTGVPKLVGYANSCIHAHTVIQVWTTRLLRMQEKAALFLTFVHGRMYSALGVCLDRGFPLLVLTDPDPQVAGPLMAEERPGILETFPNVYLYWEQLAAHPSQPLANVGYFVSTFDAVHPRSIKMLLHASRRRLPFYVQGYGTTETGPLALKVYTRAIAERTHGRCVGHPVPGFSRLRIRRRAEGRPGEIQCRARGGALMYVGEPERVAPGPGRAWWSTADIGYRTWLGCYHLLDRAVDEPSEVRSALLTEDDLLQRLPRVTEIVVLPSPHGPPQPVVATPDGGPLDAREWSRAVGDRPLAEPIYCRWDAIPRTSTWKVRRLELRRQLEAGEFAGKGART